MKAEIKHYETPIREHYVGLLVIGSNRFNKVYELDGLTVYQTLGPDGFSWVAEDSSGNVRFQGNSWRDLLFRIAPDLKELDPEDWGTFPFDD